MGSFVCIVIEKRRIFNRRDYQSKRMGKGEGSGEGWGEGQGKGGEWKGDLCSSCNAGTKCCVGCCCPMVGNFFIADKIGHEGWQKFIGILDCFGGGGIFSAIGAM